MKIMKIFLCIVTSFGRWGKNEFYEALSAMKLAEKVRAALDEANYEQHLEQKLKETHELD